MRSLFSIRRIPTTLVALAFVVAGILVLIPPETTLGWKIRVVLLHGALARTGLTLFAAGAVVAGIAVLTGRESWHGWTRTIQYGALVAWIVYFLSSILATWLTWERPFAWAEPRTQASIKILIMAIAFVPLSKWIDRSWFTALMAMVAGPVAIYLVRSAAVVQHPVDPVMGANAIIFPILFLSLWATLTIAAFQSTRWWHFARTEIRT